MEVFLTSLIICSINIILGLYMIYRNDKVANFKIMLGKLSHDIVLSYLYSLKSDEELNRNKEYYDRLCKCKNEICNISYDKMLWSLKPLTIEKWLTKEQIEFLKLKFD